MITHFVNVTETLSTAPAPGRPYVCVLATGSD